MQQRRQHRKNMILRQALTQTRQNQSVPVTFNQRPH